MDGVREGAGRAGDGVREATGRTGDIRSVTGDSDGCVLHKLNLTHTKRRSKYDAVEKEASNGEEREQEVVEEHSVEDTIYIYK